MNENNKIKMGVLSDENGKVLHDALMEIETQIEPKKSLISNFVVKSEDRDIDSLRSNIKSNLRNKKAVYNNNTDVELLDRFIKIHEKEIERIRKFEIWFSLFILFDS